MKPIRTASGVAPVTVLTKPFPCPGECIFCPSDVRMPKSYLSDEPGAQRAAQHHFDPYAQSLSRLLAYHNNGHRVDKIELIILGGTWSHYPEGYQIWFVKRCFDAMNDLPLFIDGASPSWTPDRVDFSTNQEHVDGRAIERRYNAIVSDFLRDHPESEDEKAEWADLYAAQLINETALARCVGLVVETRPDNLTKEEVTRIRRLGATKVQIGFQSLSDEVLELNQRGHDVAATARAVKLLRSAGFKLHAHWMPNLYGSSPEADVEDFNRMFEEADFRPDELKIYPCSLIESAELMAYYQDGRWRPYSRDELMFVLTECLRLTPAYCRVTRVIRDIPGTDIVDGNRLTNFRELAEGELDLRGKERQEIRSREVRFDDVEDETLSLGDIEYTTSIGREHFLEFTTDDGQLAAFLRLSLPAEPVPIAEIAMSAMIREVHVYGVVVGLGDRRDGRSQHLGLGTRLIERAGEIAQEAGFSDLAVISSVGTREYYRRLGFEDDELYQHKVVSSP
jgi:elongator complex protein 3